MGSALRPPSLLVRGLPHSSQAAALAPLRGCSPGEVAGLTPGLPLPMSPAHLLGPPPLAAPSVSAEARPLRPPIIHHPDHPHPLLRQMRLTGHQVRLEPTPLHLMSPAPSPLPLLVGMARDMGQTSQRQAVSLSRQTLPAHALQQRRQCQQTMELRRRLALRTSQRFSCLKALRPSSPMSQLAPRPLPQLRPQPLQ